MPGFMAGAIVSKLTLDKSQWSQSISSVKKDEKKMAGMSTRMAGKFKKVGRAMTIAGGAILGVVAGVVKAYAGFDQAMTESLAIMGNVSDTMRKKMVDAAKEMSGKSTFAAKDLADAYFFLASAGLDAEKSIAALPVVTKFAQAGAFDLARATDLLTDAQSALGLASKDAAKNQDNMIRVSDVLVKANTLANASVSQFSEALTNRAGPSMRAYGVELESGVAVLAAFADQGVKGSEAGMQYAIVLRDLQKATMENKEAFEKAGIAVFDAQGNLNNMGDIIGQLETRMGGMSAEQKKAELSMLGFQERSQAALLTLVGTSEKIKDYEKNLRSAGGITDEVSKKQLESLTSQLKLAKNTIVNTAISLGEKLAPMVVDIAQKISETVKKVQAWIEAHPKLSKTIVKVVAGLGAILTIFGPILIILPKLVAGIVLLKGAFLALLGPIGLVAAAATAAFVIFNKLKKSKEYLAEATERADRTEKNLIDKLKRAADAAGWTRAEFHQLSLKYGENAAAMSVAIRRGKEGEELQKALAGQARKTKGAFVEQTGVVEGLTDAYVDNKVKSEELLSLIATMTDEVKKYTKDEFEYRIDKARELYKERHDLLEKSGGDEEDFALLERTLNLELADIEKDRTEAFIKNKEKEEKAEEDRVEKQRQLYETAEGFIDGYTDTVMQYTKDEYEYKDWALKEWYKNELQTLKDSLGNTELYLKAKERLDEAYAVKVVELNRQAAEDIGKHWQMVVDGLGGSFGGFVDGLLDEGTTAKEDLANLWEDIKGTFRGVIAEMAREWATGFIKNLISGATEAGTSIASSLGSSISTLSTGLTGLVTSVGQALISIAQAIATSAQILATAAGALVKVGLVAIALYAAFGLVKGVLGKIFGAGKGGEADIVQELKKVVSATEYVRNHWRKSHKRWMDTDRSAKKIVTINRAILKTNRAGFREVVKAIKQVKLDIPGAAKGEYIPRPSIRVVAEKVPEVISPVPEIQHMVESAAERGASVVPETKQVNVIHNVNLKYELRDIIDGESVRKLVREKVLPETIETLRVNFRGLLSETKKALA